MDGHSLHYQLNPDGTFGFIPSAKTAWTMAGSFAGKDIRVPIIMTGNSTMSLDWVWPQPATEAEIQNYYAHPPK